MAHRSLLPRLTRSIAKRADILLTAVGLPGKLPVNSTFEKSYKQWIHAGADAKHRYDYELGPEDIVFDLGGYHGDWAFDIHERYGSQIHVFEPLDTYCDLIQQRFTDNEKIHVHRFGLSADDGQLQLGVLEDESSQFKQATETVTCQLKSAAQFIEANQIDRVALMKINIEGGEYDLLDSLIDSGLIERFGDIQVQFHWFVPDAHRRMQRIQSALERTHRTTYQFPFVWENWTSRAA